MDSLRYSKFPRFEEHLDKLNVFIKDLDYDKNTHFTDIEIKEYDLVELLVEDEKHSKFDVHKGNRGCVISNCAIQIKLK